MKTKIVVVGIGGVGGYYGGLLAKKYKDDDKIEICFFARGEHLHAIRTKGLTVKTEKDDFVAYPDLASDEANEIGQADYIILSTKSYDLENTISQIKPMIKENTVVLPLLNGIGITPKIRELLPETEVWYGCVYIVGRKLAPGVVASLGGVHDFFFGNEKRTDEKIRNFEKLLINAGINAQVPQDVLARIWHKFFFISATATLTSYYNVSFGALLTDQERFENLKKILDELYLVSQAEKINIDDSIVENTLKHIRRLPPETTSSMHSDFKSGNKTEIETLTHIVIQLAEKHGIELPVYKKIYAALNESLKNESFRKNFI